MKIRIRIRKKKYVFTFGYLNEEKQWEEEYDVEEKENPEIWGINLIARFNDTLKPFEKSRKYISCKLVGDAPISHTWEKMTSGMSVHYRGVYVDIFVCTVCGITGKRYGLGTEIVIDSKYKAKKYKTCNPK